MNEQEYHNECIMCGQLFWTTKADANCCKECFEIIVPGSGCPVLCDDQPERKTTKLLRYNMKQGNFIIYPEESMEGEWVKYHFIKDDRALLEEAVLELEGLRDHINQDVMHYVWNEEDKKRIDDFLARAKERLGK